MFERDAQQQIGVIFKKEFIFFFGRILSEHPGP
jgi:hypothetical protein